ncbi:MAG: LTA synthase family protein [Clostridiales bacterium]|nr:LTA synthase family protein [Clostridiales bacterium]
MFNFRKLNWSLILFLLFNTLKLVCFNVIISDNIGFMPIFIGMKFILNSVLVFCLFVPLLKNKLIKTCLFVYSLQFVYLTAHLCYFKYFHNYLHIMQTFTLFAEGTKALANLYFFLDGSFLFLFIDLPFFIHFMRNKSKDVHCRFPTIISMFVIAGLSAFCYINLFAPYINDRSLSPLLVAPNETDIVRKYGTLTNDVFSFCANKSEVDILKSFSYGKPVSVSDTPNTKNNIVILQLESIDANVVNKTYNGKYIAPYLHELSKKCVYYPYMMSYHMGGGTSDSEFSILNSIEPLQHYPAMKLKSYDYPNSFLKSLNANDYTCLAFHGNVAKYFNRLNAFPKMGFSKFYDIFKMRLSNKGWGASDGDVLDFTFNKLTKTKSPFLAYIITMTSHASFTNASHYYNNNLYDDIEDEVVKNYFNSVSYVDMVLKDFITSVRETMPNTYVFVWGDHTPAINKPLYSQASLSYDKKYFEFVPLLIITPDNKTYTERSKVASFLDIALTVLNASNSDFSISTNGIDLLDFSNTDAPAIPFKNRSYSRETLFSELIANN